MFLTENKLLLLLLSNNILADTLSHLIAIDPDTPTTPKEPGYEFGYAIFEEFPKVQTKTYEVNEVIEVRRKRSSKMTQNCKTPYNA